MMHAPERIWAWLPHGISTGRWQDYPPYRVGLLEETEYVRADLYDALKAQRDELLAALPIEKAFSFIERFKGAKE